MPSLSNALTNGMSTSNLAVSDADMFRFEAAAACIQAIESSSTADISGESFSVYS